MFKRIKKGRFLVVSLVLLAGLYLTVSLCDKKVSEAGFNRMYSDTSHMPANKVGLLLGTGRVLRNGYLNPYYSHRIDAAVLLMKSGKIKYLVISGDNSRKSYNEPQMMKTDLIQKGIDSTLIFLDYAGFRTFDSMVRLKEIFSQDSVTIISQLFHNQRALYIAQREGIHAIAFNAEDVGEKFGFKVRMREKFARVKVFLDYLLGTDPKFLGPKVNIP